MYRLFFLMIAAIFGYMLWRIVRVVMRSGGGSSGGDGTVGRAPGSNGKPTESFKNVKDADFEDLNPPDTGGSPGPSGPGT
jgi:hypothetical protein